MAYKMTLEQMMEDPYDMGLCEFCSTKPEHISGGCVQCDGKHCKEAYDAYRQIVDIEGDPMTYKEAIDDPYESGLCGHCMLQFSYPEMCEHRACCDAYDDYIVGMLRQPCIMCKNKGTDVCGDECYQHDHWEPKDGDSQ